MFELQLAGLVLHTAAVTAARSCQYFMKLVPTAKWEDLVMCSASVDPDFYSVFTWPFVCNMHICQMSWQFQNQTFFSVKEAYVHYLK